MIRRLSSNAASFNPINFGPGFNAIVADQAPDATETDSRNARGKTSVLHVLNFMLGGNLAPELRPLATREWEFTLRLDLQGHEVEVTRALAHPRRVRIEAPIALVHLFDNQLLDGSISNDEWKDVLGLVLFGLEPTDTEVKGTLSARTLLNYVVRIDPGRNPLKIAANQAAWSWRQHIAFLLNLDWRLTYSMIKKGRDQKTLASVAVAPAELDLPSFRSEEQLELERVAIVGELGRLQTLVRNFRVIDDTEGLSVRVTRLTAAITQLRDSTVVDRRMDDLYREALSDLGSGDQGAAPRIEEMYSDLGLAFAPDTLRRVEDVRAFHDRLSANRREFLTSEIAAIEVREVDRRATLEQAIEDKEAALRDLQQGGAFDELLALQAELASAEGQAAEVDLGLRQVREVAAAREQLRVDRALERQRATEDLESSRSKIQRISERFDAKITHLYDAHGALTATVDDDGFYFRVAVDGGASSGVNRMQLFCFDLTLLEESGESSHHPDFLVHDSVLFDGVDPRQQGAALHLAHEIVKDGTTQYLCAINSNDVPPDIAKETWFVDGTVRTVLDTEPSGIFGLPF